MRRRRPALSFSQSCRLPGAIPNDAGPMMHESQSRACDCQLYPLSLGLCLLTCTNQSIRRLGYNPVCTPDFTSSSLHFMKPVVHTMSMRAARAATSLSYPVALLPPACQPSHAFLWRFPPPCSAYELHHNAAAAAVAPRPRAVQTSGE